MKTKEKDPCGPIGRAPIRPEILAAKLHAIRNYGSSVLPEELTKAPRRVEALNQIQAMSLRPGGLLKYVEQILAELPERIGTPTLRVAGRNTLTIEQKRQIYFEMPKSHRPFFQFVFAPGHFASSPLSVDERARIERENSRILRAGLAGLDSAHLRNICLAEVYKLVSNAANHRPRDI
jgi:hypothetical protein